MDNVFFNKHEIAILLGVYNAEEYISVQIQSIINQTYTDWTLYIRDDASTDNTLMILRQYVDEYPNIVLITDKDGNLGCNGNYFRLLSLVESKYYMFCNADDYWYNTKIELSIKRIREVEEVHCALPIIVHSDLSIGDIDLNVTVDSYWEAVNTNPEFFKSYNLIGICNIVAGATMIFNDLTKKVTYPVHKDAPFFDHWMALRVVKTGIISSIYEPTMIYRQIGTNLAAVSIGKNNTIMNKIRHLRRTLQTNRREWKMLNNIEWGGFIKYLYFKVVVLYKLRFLAKYSRTR